MEQLPLDLHGLGRLAQQDLKQAAIVFLEQYFLDLDEFFADAAQNPPATFTSDLIPFLKWLAKAVEAERSGWLPESLVHRLFVFPILLTSPLAFRTFICKPGETLAPEILNLPGFVSAPYCGEGEHTIVIDEINALAGAHLGVTAFSPSHVRLRQVHSEELEVIQSCRRLADQCLERFGLDDASYQLLYRRFRRLLTSSNNDYPATVRRLQSMTARGRLDLWSQLLAFQRQQSLPARFRPTQEQLEISLEQLKTPLVAADIRRLCQLLQHILASEPKLAGGHAYSLQVTQSELENYLSRAPDASTLAGWSASVGLEWVNWALLRLQEEPTTAALPLAPADDESWSPELRTDLVDFLENFIRPQQLPLLDPLAVIDPLELLRHALRRQSQVPLPFLGDPAQVMQAFFQLEAQFHALLHDRFDAPTDKTGPATKSTPLLARDVDAPTSSTTGEFVIRRERPGRATTTPSASMWHDEMPGSSQTAIAPTPSPARPPVSGGPLVAEVATAQDMLRGMLQDLGRVVEALQTDTRGGAGRTEVSAMAPKPSEAAPRNPAPNDVARTFPPSGPALADPTHGAVQSAPRASTGATVPPPTPPIGETNLLPMVEGLIEFEDDEEGDAPAVSTYTGEWRTPTEALK